jgi:dTDP-4-dehydrorhamnose 3,5-epimerase
MKVDLQQFSLKGIRVVRPNRIFDSRGYFVETYVRGDFAAVGIEQEFIQENESRSNAAGTIRGLHFQVPPFAQSKLIRVLRGRIVDVVVDLRRSSPSYGKQLKVELSEVTGDQLFVPAGFAHGFCTLEPDSVVLYKVDNVYSAAHERGIYWADPSLAIGWPVSERQAVISEKDRVLPQFCDLPAYFD